MSDNFMILPSSDPNRIRLVRIPVDREVQEAFRHVTGLIAESEQQDGGSLEAIDDSLEAHGYERVEFFLGPSIE